MARRAERRLIINGKVYFRPFLAPVVGICLDGGAQDYVDAAGSSVMPFWHSVLASGRGTHGMVRAVMPTFTNPNNMSIVTGTPPAEHGISGNFFLDDSGKERMMDDPAYLRVPTVLAELSAAGTSVACVTAKGKLLRMLRHGLDPRHSFGFSVEHADSIETSEDLSRVAGITGGAAALNSKWGMQIPTIYDPDCSIYCLESGLRLLECGWGGDAPVLYLSTTDYVQHMHPPGSTEANSFYAKVDAVLGALDAAGAVVGLTADHGMSDKTRPGGGPAVVFAESQLRLQGIDAVVILPITDPYVVHHSALGGYATVYVDDSSRVKEACALLTQLPGIELVLPRMEAAERFELPADRIGDLVVFADAATVIGRTPEYHDLGSVPTLRSHGSLSEQWVPMWLNRRLTPMFARRLREKRGRNFELFEYLLNAVVH